MREDLVGGFGRTDITPEVGTLLMGYPVPDRKAEAIRDPLHVDALVLRQNDTAAVVLSLTVSIIDDPEVESIRHGVEARTGIPAEHVTVCAIQTHSAPRTQEVWGWCEKDSSYMEFMVDRAVEAAAKANDALRPIRLGIGATHSDVGINRRSIMEDHTVVLGANPWGIYDPEMTVLRLQGEREPLATIIHYGAHPTVFDKTSRVVSRDWPGVMTDRVEALTGAPAMFINGAVGDVAPRSNTLRAVGDGEPALMEVGYRAAMDALRAYRSVKDFAVRDLKVVTGDYLLPYRPLPALEEARRQLTAAEEHKDEYGRGMCEYKHWQAVIQAHADSPLPGKRYRQVITALGPAAIVPIPGEPFAETVLRLRQYSPAQYTLCASTSCGSNGYFATRESLHRGGYEVWIAKALGAYILAENIDDVLVEENVKLVRQAYLQGNAEKDTAPDKE